MKKIEIKKANITVADIVLGCMRISDMEIKEVEHLIDTSLEVGINFFDHADIYGGGKSEEVFSKALKAKREDIILQSKCGIRKGMFDFSKEHIETSVEGILKRLNTEYLDILLLHRPDTLMEPEEVAEAFSKLKNSGKVKHFGVSNCNPMQIELLSKYVEEDLVINQLQFSATNTGMVDSGLNVNMEINPSIDRDGSILEYCRLKDITIQAWSPFQYGFFEGVFLDNPKFKELNKRIDELAKKYGVKNTAIAVAWINRHPAKMQTIIGTTNSQRVRDIAEAAKVTLTREEWYSIYLAAGNKLP